MLKVNRIDIIGFPIHSIFNNMCLICEGGFVQGAFVFFSV